MLKERLKELHRKIELENKKEKKLQKIWDKVGVPVLFLVAIGIILFLKMR